MNHRLFVLLATVTALFALVFALAAPAMASKVIGGRPTPSGGII